MGSTRQEPHIKYQDEWPDELSTAYAARLRVWQAGDMLNAQLPN